MEIILTWLHCSIDVKCKLQVQRKRCSSPTYSNIVGILVVRIRDQPHRLASRPPGSSLRQETSVAQRLHKLAAQVLGRLQHDARQKVLKTRGTEWYVIKNGYRWWIRKEREKEGEQKNEKD
jgi:hypothetical protein